MHTKLYLSSKMFLKQNGDSEDDDISDYDDDNNNTIF
jgi:hypothetical protein